MPGCVTVEHGHPWHGKKVAWNALPRPLMRSVPTASQVFHTPSRRVQRPLIGCPPNTLQNRTEQGSPLPTQSSAAPARVRHEVKRWVTRAGDEARFHTWALTAEGRANARRVQALKGRYHGRRSILMGNGPSLLKSDLNRLASEITLVSNAHYLIWDQLTYVPTFLSVEDRLVAEDRADELRSLEGIVRIFPFDLRDLLGPAEESKLYINFQREYRPFPRFSWDVARRVYWGGTVSFMNLQLAAYLGCDPIVLIGFDHNYVVPAEELQDGVIHSTVEDVNHIHPKYFGPGYRWHDPHVPRMELAYRKAREELERQGSQVINATVGGHLEVFTRASLESVLGAA